MPSKRKELETRLGLIAFAMAERSFQRQTADKAERTGARYGRLLQKLSRKHRERAALNLELAFPELDQDQRESIARGVFEHFGRVTADFLRSEKRSADEVLNSVKVTGEEHLMDAQALGKGVIFITGHYGNWERMAHWLSAKGYPLTVVARDANDTSLNQRVLKIREHAGIQVLSRGNAARSILVKLKRKEIVGILPDQNARDLFVPFFGKPAGSVEGPGVIHQRTGAPVVAGFCTWISPGEYQIEFQPVLTPEPGYEVSVGMMRTIHQVLEQQIRRHPAQWLWFHDRWKDSRKAGLL